MTDIGPAFPTPEIIVSDGAYLLKSLPGMTLRDYFAARAMAAMMIAGPPSGEHSPAQCLAIAKDLARNSYMMADFMLEERAKVKP